MSVKERQRASYDRYFREYEQAVERVHARLKPYTVNQWRERCADKDILDVGCGTGYLLGQLVQATIPFRSYLGIDISPEMIKHNAQEYRSSRSASFLVDDAETLGRVPDASFDVVISYGCLHHLEGPEAAIQSIAKKLRSGGEFFALELNRRHAAASFVGVYAALLGLQRGRFEGLLARVIDHRRAGFRDGAYSAHHPGHPGKRTPAEYRQTLSASGLEPQRIRCLYLNLFPGFVYRSNDKLFRLMVALSSVVMKCRSLRDVGPIVLIEARR